jgi:hypothetical protein
MHFSLQIIVAGLLLGIFPLRAEEPAAQNLPVNPAGPVPSEARHLALDALRPFAKEGFHIRDGEWSDELTKGEPRFLQVTLFAGERYLFAVASPLRAAKLRLSLFDAAGKEVKSEIPKEADPTANGGSKGAVVEVAPGKSGNYFVRVELVESPGTGPCEFSLVYAYK